GHRLSGDMAVHPLHRIDRGEWQRSGEHLVERDAERVEVAASIDRPVHSAGLFGRHVGERARDRLRRLERLPLPRQVGSDSERCEPNLTRRRSDQRMSRLHIFVNQSSSVQATESAREADGDTQELRCVHRCRRRFLESTATGSSSTSIFCPRCSESASGRTAQAESSCSRKAYSRSIFFSVASEGCSEEGARTRIDGSPRSLECSARYRTNSSSLRRGSRTYCDRFTPPPTAFLPEMSTQLAPRWPRLQSHSQ